MNVQLPTVHFDGACPICRREISFYRRRRGAEKINWIDISKEDAPLPGTLSPAAARARFHVKDTTGRLLSGGVAFAYLLTRFPSLRYAGLLATTRPFVWLLEPGYDLFLRVRPKLQRLFS
jgi:predicted DCC family thiol-disulfide oxidoreductase YuxK